MYCRFREPVVELRFLRYLSFVCRCGSGILNHPHLGDSLLMLMLLLLWINALSFHSHRKTTFSTLSLLPVCHVTAKVNVITLRRRCDYCSRKKRHSFLDVWYTAFSCTMVPSGPLVHSYILASLPSLVPIFFSVSIFSNCHGSKNHTRQNRIPIAIAISSHNLTVYPTYARHVMSCEPADQGTTPPRMVGLACRPASGLRAPV